MKLRQLRVMLRQAGFVARQNGTSHEVWTNHKQPGCRVVLAGHDGQDAPKYQIKRVRRLCDLRVAHK